mmetsp:Transcript_102046/g.284892  ORF Transcript_102046/g.284892 Transcript_102046/m.284892 type:complete len:307 (-) Transcript_102046:867-1787(-)
MVRGVHLHARDLRHDIHGELVVARPALLHLGLRAAGAVPYGPLLALPRRLSGDGEARGDEVVAAGDAARVREALALQGRAVRLAMLPRLSMVREAPVHHRLCAGDGAALLGDQVLARWLDRKAQGVPRGPVPAGHGEQGGLVREGRPGHGRALGGQRLPLRIRGDRLAHRAGAARRRVPRGESGEAPAADRRPPRGPRDALPRVRGRHICGRGNRADAGVLDAEVATAVPLAAGRGCTATQHVLRVAVRGRGGAGFRVVHGGAHGHRGSRRGQREEARATGGRCDGARPARPTRADAPLRYSGSER